MKTADYIHDNVYVNDNGCWIWQRSLNSAGYGNAWDGEKRCGAHVLSYRIFKGDPPPGSQIDHRKGCPRHCVSPHHLTAVSRDVNAQLAYRRKKGQWSRRDLRVARWLHKQVSERISG